MNDILNNDIKFLSGVGERRASMLRKELGIATLGDLLYHFPFRYIDRTRIWKIGELDDDSLTYIQLKVRITGFQHVGAGSKRRFIATVSDGSGVAELVWFKGISWIEKRLEQGREYVVFLRSLTVCSTSFIPRSNRRSNRPTVFGAECRVYIVRRRC